MNTTTPSRRFKLSACGKGNLIPKLPNELALLCLARVPRRHHHTLSEVSKAIRAAVSSPQFFEIRSVHGLSEEVLYVSIRSPFDSAAVWFSLHRSQGQDQSVRVPVPPHPMAGRLHGWGSVALGAKIYAFGGSTRSGVQLVKSREVWVLDCQSNSWSRGPDMLAPRCEARGAILDGRIYVVGSHGGCFPFAEVLSEGGRRWEALPEPPPLGDAAKTYAPRSVVAHGGTIRAWCVLVELRLEAERGRWEMVELERDEVASMTNKWVVGGRLFAHHRGRGGGVKRFDEGAQEWKKVEGLKRICGRRYWAGPRFVGIGRGQMVALTGAGAGEFFGRERERGTYFDVWCSHFDAASGTLTCIEKLYSKLSSTPRAPGCGLQFGEWNLFSISL